jgi:predicted Fe-Mo cluster-binding NifX family protein
MKVVVSAQGEDLSAQTSPVFGRCPMYVFVDTETLAYEAMPNPGLAQSGGAGIRAAQAVLNHGAQAVLSGNLGPNAFEVLRAAGIPAYQVREGTVLQAVEDLKAGRLPSLSEANVTAHSGSGPGGGAGFRSRDDRDADRGTARPKAAQSSADPARDAEIAALHDRLRWLRGQLAETMEQIEKLGLQKEN